MANQNNWPADSFDFNSAFLNSVLSNDKVIFLEQPPKFFMDNLKKFMFRLHKALYGLKQGAKNRYDCLKEALEQLGFVQTEMDHGVFVKKWADGCIVVVAVHVDDCLVIGSLQELVNGFKQRINNKYQMTDLGATWLQN